MTWLHLTVGRGPAECRIALAGFLKALAAEAEGLGLTAAVLEAEDAPHGPVSALVALQGDGADRFAASWVGAIAWVCKSPLRPTHGRKRWFVGVDLLEPPPPSSSLRVSDVVFSTCRASGAGGQHVNKTDSAVRAVHRPSGIVVFAQEERSQHRNRSLALARLAVKLAQRDRVAETMARRGRWDQHNGLERGNAVRVYEGAAFLRIHP